MTKRIAILAALVAVAMTLAGCGFKPPIQWNEAEELLAVLGAANGWAQGVEDYNVEAMAGNGILAQGFKLLIYEGATLGSKKDGGQLRMELDGSAAEQAYYREDKGYELRLDIDPADADAGDGIKDANNEWKIELIDRTNAKVTGKFEVYETADCLPDTLNGGRIVGGWWNSDNGEITIELIRTPNAWKMIAMTIVFYYPDAGAGAAALSSPVGLGLGKLSLEFGW